MRALLSLGLLLSLFIPTAVSAADAPMTTLQGAVGRVMSIIDDQSLQGEDAQAEKVKLIEEIVDTVFDYDRIARLSLGKNWHRITPAEQEEFTRLFSKFLGQVYITKITSFPGSKVVYGDAVALSDKVTEIRTQVVTKEVTVPINYRLTTDGAGWKVYDVIVEGVSLLNNYRSQFHSLLANKPMENLLGQLRAKVESYGS